MSSASGSPAAFTPCTSLLPARRKSHSSCDCEHALTEPLMRWNRSAVNQASRICGQQRKPKPRVWRDSGLSPRVLPRWCPRADRSRQPCEGAAERQSFCGDFTSLLPAATARLCGGRSSEQAPLIGIRTDCLTRSIRLRRCSPPNSIAVARRLLASLHVSLHAFLELSARRERALAETLESERARLSSALLQRGLFDRRAERHVAAQSAVLAEALLKCQTRLSEIAAATQIAAEPGQLAFVAHPAMIPGVHGRLLTASFIRDRLRTLPGVSAPPPTWTRRLAECTQRIEAALGAASSVRAITDVAVLPLIELLGLQVVRNADVDGTRRLELAAGEHSVVIALTTGWGEPLDRLWRSSIVDAIGADARWCLCCNGRALRLVDARRTWSRDYLEFDLVLLGREPEAQAVLWTVARAGAIIGNPPLLDTAVALSRHHGTQVCRALGAGVLEALEVLLTALTRGGRQPSTVLWEQSLTVLYRVLFLLFAEARGLVPLWHPVYRERYSLETIVTTLLEDRECKGLWRAVQAISRLAHAGCTAGELRVTAFNGRLFAPSQAVAFDSTRLSDNIMGRTVIALSSTPNGSHGGRTKILYRDLDVEQLGAVYERVLEFEPTQDGALPLNRTRDIRKSSGSFYTPRALTTFLVRQTLEPLIRGRTADEILALRVLDPAMGSGAFLVAACRYLAWAVEEALIHDGQWHAHDVTHDDRVALRREIASRCLFGVDLNPMAVQLARLSLWLATLAADKPLSFLDHHLVTGHSLIGATPEDMTRQPGGRHRRTRKERLSLFDESDFPATIAHAASVMSQVSTEPDDSADVVRAKERALRALQAQGTSVAKWTEALDLWCAAWFWSDGKPLDRAIFLDLASRLLDRPATLPARTAEAFLQQARTVACRHRFLHWPLAFSDVFARQASSRLPGFDAVIGNPPWDMVRGDSGEGETRTGRRLASRQMIDFVRQSGIYRVESRAHVNLYQLFVERALQLVRPEGRIGFVLPSGLISDAGAAPLRQHLFDRSEVDDIAGFDNRLAIFPVHRSVRFVLLTCTTGRQTASIRCRFGLTSVSELESPGARTARHLTASAGQDLRRRRPRDPGARNRGRPRNRRGGESLRASPRRGGRMARRVRARTERQRRSGAVRADRICLVGPSGDRGQAGRALSGNDRQQPIGRPGFCRVPSARSTSRSARVSRRGERGKPPDAHRSHRSSPCRHHAYALLPPHAAPAPQSARPVRAAQQLCRELSRSPSREHARDRLARLPPAGSGHSRPAIHSLCVSRHVSRRSPMPPGRPRRWRSTPRSRP